MSISSRFDFTGAHGLRLAAEAWGPADGRPVVLLHGGGQTRHSWGGTARALAGRGYRAITVDARGHGDSGWDPERRYAMEAFVADFAALHATFAEPPAVVGASLGGMTGMLGAGARGLNVAA